MNLRPAYLAGALTIAISGSALALTQAQSKAQTPSLVPTAQTAPQVAGSPARVVVRSRQLNARQGQPVVLRGALDPATQGQTVVLQVRSGRGWHKLASTKSAASGSFALRFVAGQVGSQQLRVSVPGKGSTASSSAPAGRLTVYRQSIASWYEDGSSTACGFHAARGVASRTLPCGAHVAFLLGGHRVTAVVDDRGPFVSGRDWDLDQATAAALGFGGVGPVWSSA